MKRYIIPLLLLILLLGCVSNKPLLSVSSISTSPDKPYEGDMVTITANIANTGSAEAKDFVVEFNAANISLKTETLTLQPNSDQIVSASWVPYSAGNYSITVTADSGNSISAASVEKQKTVSLSVLPSESVDIFSALPSGELQDIGVINITGAGLNAIYTYSSIMQELPQYVTLLKPYIQNLKEVRVGTLDYANMRGGTVIFLRGAISAQQLSDIASTLVANLTVSSKMINGVNTTVISGPAFNFPICIWREKGWLRITQFADLVTFDTCDTISNNYDTSYADKPLSVAGEFAKEPPFNTTLLGETLYTANMTNGTPITQYGAAFEDDAGFYGFYATKLSSMPTNNTCQGVIINSSTEHICAIPPSTNSTFAIAQRRVGNYSIICISTPKTGDLTVNIENKALDFCFSLNYSGEEATWMSAGQ